MQIRIYDSCSAKDRRPRGTIAETAMDAYGSPGAEGPNHALGQCKESSIERWKRFENGYGVWCREVSAI